MDENNVHTSVVIELANQEEPEDKYRIDINDKDSPKDYVIDQIFCGENVTVYALFEVPEDSKISDKNLINVPNSHLQEPYKFFHKSSYKEVTNEKKINRFKHKSSVIRSEEDLKFLSDKDRTNGSLYCLKHLSGDYGILTPEEESSELKVLYNKDAVIKSTKFKTPKKLKVKSKGVNTDIVQSPKILEEVQRAVEVNIPFVKNKEKSVEDFFSSFNKSSYEVIEMEMRQSYSSVNSDSDNKSVPNFFIVPLLMTDEGILNRYEKSDKSQKTEEEKLLFSKKIIASKVSLGTNTDISIDSYKKTDQDLNEISQSESYKTDSENCEDQNIHEKNENSNEKLKINNKEMIIKEIKMMQRKLNFLIKSIESNDFVYNAKENESSKTFKDRTENLERMSEPWLNETCQKIHEKFEKCPVFLPFKCPSYPNKIRAKTNKKIQSINESINSEIATASKKSVSNDFLPNDVSSQTMVVRNDQTVEDKIKKLTSNCLINYFDLEIRKVLRQSKSESCVRVIIPASKHTSNNGLKKSQSFDLKGDKMEALKKTKNFLYKVEGSIKTKINMRIHQNKEGSLRDNLSLMKCEMGDDIDKKAINTNNEMLNVVTEKTEKSEKLEIPEKSENSCLKAIVADMKKNSCEEEGDAKLDYPKETLVTANVETVQVNYHYANIIASESVLKQKQSISPRTVTSKTSDKNAEVGTKINSDVEKLMTPNKSNRKINTTERSARKDVKIYKKINDKVNVTLKANKSEGKDFSTTEAEKKKTLIGSRKFARNNAESKLHINKLIKLDNLGNNHRSPLSAKINHDEKTGARNERLPRPVSQKQDRLEHPINMLFDENIKEKSEISAKKSVPLVGVESFRKNNVKEKDEPVYPGDEEKTVGGVNLNLGLENLVPLSGNPSSVAVELFSQKPKSMNEYYYGVDEENLEKLSSRENAIEKNRAEKESNENSENLEKSVIKSVWALTKVLLYEDGTNKLEVLEASLTPPDYSLN